MKKAMYKKGDKIWMVSGNIFRKQELVVFVRYKNDNSFIYHDIDQPDWFWIADKWRLIGKYNEFEPKRIINKFTL